MVDCFVKNIPFGMGGDNNYGFNNGEELYDERTHERGQSLHMLDVKDGWDRETGHQQPISKYNQKGRG